MKINLYSLRDLKIGYGPLQCDLNDQSAIRNFRNSIRTSGRLENMSPEDFQLFKVGSYDTETGVVDPITPELIADGNSLKEV